MNQPIFIITLLAIGFLSFNNPTSLDTIQNVIKNDSIKKFKVDDYPISNELLRDNSYKKVSGPIELIDQAWFTNDTLKQTIVIGLYTDLHRMEIHHFYNNNIPHQLLKQMEMYVKNNVATEEEKRKNINGFIEQSKKISKSHFTTNKGLKLGWKNEQCIKLYGQPDKITKADNIEKYEWNFIGDAIYDGKLDLKGKPLAKNSFGHRIDMYFQNEKLIALCLFNDIP